MSETSVESVEESSTGNESGETKSKKELLKQKLSADTVDEGIMRVSFRSNNSIAPNLPLVERHLQDVEAFSFIYLQDENTLVIIPLEEYDENATDEYPIRGADETSATVSCQSIFHKIGIDIETTHRYYPEWDDKMGTIKIDLDEEPEVVRRNSQD